MSVLLNKYACLLRSPARKMKSVLVYKGKGMYDADTSILERVLKQHVDTTLYNVDTVSAADIIKGRLTKDTTLLAIGGGYDRGLIQALGDPGMINIKDYVQAGGSYLGICSGAYFACDKIEFDKDGPHDVCGERFLKFYPGMGIGPLFKPYDYQSRQGAVAATVDFTLGWAQLKEEKVGNQPTSCMNIAGYKSDKPESQRPRLDGESQPKNGILEKDHDKLNKPESQGSILDGEYQLKNKVLEKDYDKSNKPESQRPILDGEFQLKNGILEDHDNGLYSYRTELQPSKCSRKVAEDTGLNGLRGTNDYNGLEDTGFNGLRGTDDYNGLEDTGFNDLRGTDKYNGLEDIGLNGLRGTDEYNGLKDTGLNGLRGTDEYNGLNHVNSIPSTEVFNCKVYFDGGGYFASNNDSHSENVTVMSRYMDLKDRPAAIVRCRVGAGVAVLSGVHLEYDDEDIDDGDKSVTDIILCLKKSANHRRLMLKSILHQLNIVVNETV